MSEWLEIRSASWPLDDEAAAALADAAYHYGDMADWCRFYGHTPETARHMRDSVFAHVYGGMLAGGIIFPDWLPDPDLPDGRWLIRYSHEAQSYGQTAWSQW